MAPKPALIALDWGTTSLRAYLVDTSTSIIESINKPLGILQITDGDFDAVFQNLIGPWLASYGPLPAIASGMIGSRQGWREAPYMPCPASMPELAQGMTEITTSSSDKLWLVPGVSFIDADGVPDVMRGEETQLFGEITDPARRLFILPGTHSKWALVENDTITWFATFMSGEVFAILCRHSILGRTMDGEAYDADAFSKGIDYAHASHAGGLLKRLFSARTLALFDKIPATGLHAYLSGLIIGSEITEGLSCSAAQTDEIGAITVIGDSTLAEHYRTALNSRGVDCTTGTPHAVVRGLFRVAQHTGLIRKSS